MPNHQRCFRRLARLCATIAGLLFLLGTAAEPLVHAYAGTGADGSAVLVEAGESAPADFEPGVPHDDSECLLCKLGSPIVAASGGPVSADSPVRGGMGIVGTAVSRAPPAFPAAQSRAPPLA